MMARAAMEEIWARIREDAEQTLEDELSALQLAAPGPPERARAEEVVVGLVQEQQRALQEEGGGWLEDAEVRARALVDGLVGLGPLQQLLDDPEIEDIMINGYDQVYVVTGGRQEFRDEIDFGSEEELLRVVRRALLSDGREVSEAAPSVDARLADGSRLHANIPPSANYTAVSIRKFVLKQHSLSDLARLGMLSGEAAAFIEGAVQAGLNLVISGGTGSGKSTLLNAIGMAITGDEERVITIEETAELQFESFIPNCVALIGRPMNSEEAGAISVRSLVRDAMRMNPSRLIVGEVRGAEAYDVMLAMNSGHDGSAVTMHASTAEEALPKLAMYAREAAEAGSEASTLRTIAAAVQLVVHLQQDGVSKHRHIASVIEVVGVQEESGAPQLVSNELFSWLADEDRLVWTGIRSRHEQRLARAGAPVLGGPGQDGSY